MVAALRGMPAEDLALRPSHDHWPIWAIAAHTAAARVFWLCSVLGEPGAETTPFTDPTGLGWEDDLSTCRAAPTISSGRWSLTLGGGRGLPGALDAGDARRKRSAREGRSGQQVHTRQSMLLRLITHEAYHAGEIALIQGMHGRLALDLWPAGDWLAGQP